MNVDWNIVGSVFGVLVLLSLIIERGLSLVFEHKSIGSSFTGKKELVAFLLALLICLNYDIDILQALLDQTGQSTFLGMVLTAATIAGGSKGSMKLFNDALNVSNQVRKEDNA